MSAFPPHRSIKSIPISPEIALKFLSQYLQDTTTSPHLLPNARLEPSGPTAGSSNSSVTIHNLQRVEAGLRGEWLAPSLELDEAGEKGKGVPVTEGMDDGVTTRGSGEEGWMDLDEYQREQSIEGGDGGKRGVRVVAQEGDSDLDMVNGENVAEEREDGVVDENEGGDDDEDQPATPVVSQPKKVKKSNPTSGKVLKKVISKEDKKKEKKARLKEEQRKKAQEKSKPKNVED